MIYRHPDRIPAGKVSDLMTSSYDFLPTVLSYLEMGDKMPVDPPRPGKSYASALLGKEVAWENVTFHEYKTAQVIRTDRWKYTYRRSNGPHELYDLREDAGERNNLIGKEEHAAVQKDLHRRLMQFFAKYTKTK